MVEDNLFFGAANGEGIKLGGSSPLSGGAANVTVPIVAPGSVYGDRLNQTDFRVGKIVRFAGTRRVTASLDVYNLFNASSIQRVNGTYGSAYLNTLIIMAARYAKIGAQLDF